MNDQIEAFAPQWMTEAAAGEYLALSARTLQAFRLRGGGPRYAKIGRAVRYARADLDAWARSRLVRSTAEATAREGGDG